MSLRPWRLITDARHRHEHSGEDTSSSSSMTLDPLATWPQISWHAVGHATGRNGSRKKRTPLRSGVYDFPAAAQAIRARQRTLQTILGTLTVRCLTGALMCDLTAL